jgi:hypothetical protein
MCESVYCVWVQVFCGVLPSYREQSHEMVNFARKLLNNITTKLAPMKETEILYSRLFQACGNCGLQDHVKDLFREMQSIKSIDADKLTYSSYYEALMKCKDFE